MKEELAIACSVICPDIDTRRKNSGALHTRAVSIVLKYTIQYVTEMSKVAREIDKSVLCGVE